VSFPLFGSFAGLFSWSYEYDQWPPFDFPLYFSGSATKANLYFFC